MAPSVTEVIPSEEFKTAKKPTSELPNPIHPSMLDRLDQDFIDFYNTYIAIKPTTHEVSLDDVRKFPKKYAASWYKDFTYESFVNDIEIPGPDGNIIKARCYTPDSRTSPYGSGPYPVHINIHGETQNLFSLSILTSSAVNQSSSNNQEGGGFIFGDLTGDAELCMLVRDRVGILVVDVDYRLSPGMLYSVPAQ